jgi:phosphohistidine phosphatase
MKTLYLVRHAKSSWKDSDTDDRERPLNKRGEHDAPVIGKHLKKINVKPSIIISSPAKRALSTAKIFTSEIDYEKKKIIIDENIYLATPEELSALIDKLSNDLNSVMIVGHNPGITEFLNYLCKENIDNMPTCSVACIEFQTDNWSNICDQKGKLKFFEYPKNFY